MVKHKYNQHWEARDEAYTHWHKNHLEIVEEAAKTAPKTTMHKTHTHQATAIPIRRTSDSNKENALVATSYDGLASQ